MNKGRLVDVIHLGTSKALDAASHSILIWRLRKYRLEEELLGGVKICQATSLKG